MAQFIKVKKLNLGTSQLSEFGDLFGSFSKRMGLDEEYLKNLPRTEDVLLNLDKVIGISEPVRTGEKEGQMCQKVYFSKDEYWAVECFNNNLSKNFD